MDLQKEKAKIAIAVHSDGHIHPMVYANHIGTFIGWAKSHDVLFFALDGAKVAAARNLLVQAATDKKCTHILFVDADHIIKSSMLPCLLGNTEAAAVSGLVTKRTGEGPQVGFIKADEDFSYTVQLPIDGMSYDVDSCAFGCTLIKLDVFKEIEKPYFKDVTIRNKAGKLYARRSDMHFCKELKKLGKKIVIDTRVLVGHLGKPPVYYPTDEVEILIDLPENCFQVPVYRDALEHYKKHQLSHILDLGCGNGIKLRHFFKSVCDKIHGIDLDMRQIELCCLNFPQGFWRTFDITDEKECFIVDDRTLIICADVLEHLEKPKTVLEKIPENVWCVFSTPESSTVAEGFNFNGEHKCKYIKETFEKLLLDSGFKIFKSYLYPEIHDYKGHVIICRKDKVNV